MTYWFARWSILSTVEDGRSTNNQKNLEAYNPIKKTCITNEGYVGYSSDFACETYNKLGQGSVVLLARSDVTVGLGRALTKKFNSNSLMSWLKHETEDGLSRLYHIRVGL
ncbi:hypothetical protein GW17_00008163 [Ensete ventricosum]|nr:hypothetical protein GW17_00008163 [Ensete ventricosum]